MSSLPPGLYTVPSPLESTSDTTDCIQINGPGILLGLEAILTGPGGSGVSAAGIHITANAKGVSIATTSPTLLMIQGFGNGILIEGSGVTISGKSYAYQVQGSAAQGVLVQNAFNVILNNVSSIANGSAGIEVLNSSGVAVFGGSDLSSNGVHGLWVNGSTGGQFYDVQALQNDGDGIYVGTASASATEEKAAFVRPHPKACLGCLSSSAPAPNVFVAGQVAGNKGSGIVIDAGQSGNTITGMVGSENGAADAADKNNNCTLNTGLGMPSAPCLPVAFTNCEESNQ